MSELYYPIDGFTGFTVSVGFLDPSYPDFRARYFGDRAQHPAIDMGTAPGDADRGVPIRAVADGRFVAPYGPYTTFGNNVLLHHEADPSTGRPEFWSLSAHLDTRVKQGGVWRPSPFLSWAQGRFVQAGEVIGGMGDGDPKYNMAVHLHFEMRNKLLPANAWFGANVAAIQANYYSPLSFFKKYGARDYQAGETPDLHERLVTVRAGLIRWLRTQAPDVRLVTTRTYSARMLTGGALGPHNLRPALAFDFRLKREDRVLPTSDTLYELTGKRAQVLGAAWGGTTPQAVRGESALDARGHLELPAAAAIVKEREEEIRRGNQTGVGDEVDSATAGAGSTDSTQNTSPKPSCTGGTK